MVACSTTEDTEGPDVPPISMPVELALSVAPEGTAPDTRLTTTVIQSNKNFRGIQDLWLIPFKVESEGRIKKTDTSLGLLTNGGLTLDAGTQAIPMKCYDMDVTRMKTGTTSFLAYGKAVPASTNKKENGSLNVEYKNQNSNQDFLGTISTITNFSLDNITITPTQIYPSQTEKDAALANAKTVLNYMNAIASAEYTDGEETKKWYEHDGTNQKKAFDEFVNIVSGVPQGIAGSSTNIIAYVNKAYPILKGLADVGTTITAAMHNTEYVVVENDNDNKPFVKAFQNALTYPAGLPDGSAVMTWNTSSHKFEYEEVKWDDTAADYVYNKNNSKQGDYTYPAELYYFANTRIYTSNASKKDKYSEGTSSWADFLDENYENKGEYDEGTAVDTDTRSIALIDPLRYAVACLEVKVKASVTKNDDDRYYLLDDDSKHTNVDESKVWIENGSFPLTAILVGGQVEQNFDFHPNVSDAPNAPDLKQYVIYDTEGMSNGSTPVAYIYGKCFDDPTAEDQYSNPVYTLTLQTKDEEAIKVVLEFENNVQDFISENGTIYKGTKFYLVASVLPSGDSYTEEKDYQKRVMTRGYKTTIQLNIGSLKQAYNSLPSLSSDKLRLFDTVKAGVKVWLNGDIGEHEVYNW